MYNFFFFSKSFLLSVIFFFSALHSSNDKCFKSYIISATKKNNVKNRKKKKQNIFVFYEAFKIVFLFLLSAFNIIFSSQILGINLILGITNFVTKLTQRNNVEKEKKKKTRKTFLFSCTINKFWYFLPVKLDP